MADPRLYDMLKNPDAAKRKAAIQALARSKDTEAIAYLERVADNDSDASIRDIAEKAIVYINRNNPDNSTPPQLEPKRQTSTGSVTPFVGSSASSSPISNPLDDYGDSNSGGFMRVSAADEERARRLLGTALDANMRGQNAKATKAVIDAFKVNPNLKDDAYARGVASTATGLHAAEAVVKVMDGSAIELFEPKKGKAKRDGGAVVGDLPVRDKDGRAAGEETEVGFGSAMLDLFIYGLVNAVVVGGGLLLLFYVILDTLPASLLMEPVGPGVPLTFGDMLTWFTSAGVAIVLLYSALYGVFNMIALFIQAVVVHWAATSFMKGEGTLAELLHRFSVFYTILVPISLILPFVGGFIGGFFSTSSQQAFESGQNIGNVVTIGLAIYTIWGSSVRVGKTYKFGTGNGCLSLLLGTVALAFLCCIIGYGLSYAMTSSLQDLMVSP